MPASEHPSQPLHEQLIRNSTPYVDVLTRVDWASLTTESYWLPEPALSLYGLPDYAALPEARRRALSHYEFLHLLEAGLWLEGLFMRRISGAMNRAREDMPRLIYHLHELREEAGHSLMFLELMRRSGLPRPPTRFRRLPLANLLGTLAPFDSTGFWVAVLIGEELPDRLNRLMRKHQADVCPTVYDISRIHVIDEARHIAHARATLQTRLGDMPSWRVALMRPLVQGAFREFVRALYFPAPAVYELAGLGPGRRWARLARRSERRRGFVDDMVGSTLRTLRQFGIPLDWK